MLELREQDRHTLQATLARFPEVRRAWVFGSRAAGRARRASDIDLAIEAPALTPALVRSDRGAGTCPVISICWTSSIWIHWTTRYSNRPSSTIGLHSEHPPRIACCKKTTQCHGNQENCP
ncbi:nucleotidyltransferase domain-containing protein [Sulfuriferula sp. GW1]|uniref:nucleotidyltransferase domain-containing protein n=1 Tax=Sulfuriferula sp. GW1 TaxID=3345111 RepID=UPI0039B061AE